MKANGTEVYAACKKCAFLEKPLNLDRIIAVKGEAFCLFDVRGVCPKCSGPVGFHYSPGGGTPYRPCTTRR